MDESLLEIIDRLVFRSPGHVEAYEQDMQIIYEEEGTTGNHHKITYALKYHNVIPNPRKFSY